MRRASSRTFFTITSAAALVLVMVSAGCERRRPAASPAPAGATRHCEAPSSLPASLPLDENLRRAIAARDLPAGGGRRGRRVCNRLVLEPGGFARSRAVDAIDWRPWSPATLAEAKTLARPLLVLTGYANCSACAELAKKNFARRRVVRAINRRFVPVLVDRDERPDVDAYLMQAVQVLTGGAGWPAVVFLESDAKPFEAATWGAAARDERRLGRLVREVSRRVALGGGSLTERAESTSEKMQRRVTLDTAGPLPETGAVVAALKIYLADAFDEETGAFGGPPFFPRAPLLAFLLEAGKSDAKMEAMAEDSLTAILGSELADADGGFRRYARAESWSRPAGEKMLADNAALASVLLDAAATTGRADFGEAARSILDFLRSDLRLGSGAYAASIDAARGPSSRDPRVLADANGLAISALVRASRVLGDTAYRDAAVAAADAVDQALRRGGRVNHCVDVDGRLCADGYLADQTLFALACLDLDETGVGPRWLAVAREIADALPGRFGHEAGGGFFLNGADSEQLPLRYKPALDAAFASGNSAAAMLYSRLAVRTGEARYAAEAKKTFEAFAEILTLRPVALPAMATALVAAGPVLQPRSGAAASSAPPQLDPAPAVHP